MTQDWRSFLVKESISGWLIDELRGKLDEATLLGLRTIVCNSKGEIKALESLIRNARTSIDAEHYDSLCDELREIKEDNRWQGSKRGQYILAINAWVRTFHAEFNSIPEFGNVLIGSHAEKEVVFVTGKVATTADYDDLLEYIYAKQPPFKLLPKVSIAA